jgi:hypothetical protein
MPTMHPKGSKMIIVMVEMRPVVLSLPRQKACLQEADVAELETDNGVVLLHH